MLIAIGDLHLVQFLILRNNNLWKEKETLIDMLNKVKSTPKQRSAFFVLVIYLKLMIRTSA